jgi:hypothetical protein
MAKEEEEAKIREDGGRRHPEILRDTDFVDDGEDLSGLDSIE